MYYIKENTEILSIHYDMLHTLVNWDAVDSMP